MICSECKKEASKLYQLDLCRSCLLRKFYVYRAIIDEVRLGLKGYKVISYTNPKELKEQLV